MHTRNTDIIVRYQYTGHILSFSMKLQTCAASVKHKLVNMDIFLVNN